MKNQSGFTLIELVLVIIVLGILSATAMPRFVNISDDAKKATYASISSSFQASVNLVHMKWIVDGKPTNDNYQVDNIYINAYGYPRFYTEEAQECAAIFEKSLPGSEPFSDENIENVGGGLHGGNVCRYHFKDSPLYIKYDEDSGSVVLTENG